MQQWSPRPKKERAPWLFGRRPGWTSRGAGRAAWGGVAGVTGGVEGLALAADPPLVLPSRLSGLGPSGPGSWRAGSGRASRSADAEAAPRGEGWSRPRPRPPEASSRRWGVCGGNWLNQLRSGASPPARRPVGPEGAFLRQRRLRGGGRGEGRPGRGAGGRIPPLPQTGAGPEFGRYPPQASRNEGGPVRAGPWPEDGRGERQGAFRSPRAEPGGELSVGATLGR